MNKEILFKVLQLDSLFCFLNWSERALIHLMISKDSRLSSEKIFKAYNFIIEKDWQLPEMRYMDDRLLYFKHGDEWLLISEYKTLIT